MNTRDIDILIMSERIFPGLLERFERHFTVHKFWLAPDREAFVRAIAPKIRGVVTRGAGGLGASRQLMESLPALEIISSFGVGYDTIDVDAAKERGVIVTNTPGVLTDCVADAAMGMILALARRLCRADAYVREGRWPTEGAYPLGTKVSGKRIGIAGLGAIGSAVARRAAGFGMDIHYLDCAPKDVPYTYHASIEELARNADFLLLTVPGGAATANLVGARALEALGPGGYLINICRGSVVDEAALIEALQNGRIAGAALDVFANEPHVPEAFLSMDNVVLLPHTGSATRETREAMANLTFDNLMAHFTGKPPLTRVV